MKWEIKDRSYSTYTYQYSTYSTYTNELSAP